MAMYRKNKFGSDEAVVMLYREDKKGMSGKAYFKGYVKIGGTLYRCTTSGDSVSSSKKQGVKVMILNISESQEMDTQRGL